MRTARSCLRFFLIGAIVVLAAGGNSRASTAVKISGERRVSFNDHWRFLKGEAEGGEGTEFDDSRWGEIRLPHDWAIDGPFDPGLNPHTGALPISGTGWYRKSFTLPESAKGRYFSIEFDGAMANSKVWLNGSELGGRPYGYIGFILDLTPNLRFGPHFSIGRW
jgi:beta-galactosidase